jgi:hypothetical protein
MYQARIHHPLSPAAPQIPDDVIEVIWSLFLAIGDHWQLGDDTQPYRSRFEEFIRDRVAMNPLYQSYYSLAAKQINELTATLGVEQAWEILFSTATNIPPTIPETAEEFTKQYVLNELIALRLALGGFKAWGGINYCGYIGGANIEGRPIPYRAAVLP